MPFNVPEAELRFRASRAGGPGGQHVNTAATKVEVLWDIRRSPSLSEEERRRLLDKLAGRVDAAGVLHVTAGERRSQAQNRAAAIRRLKELVGRALTVAPRRRKTKPPPRAKEQRLADKKKRSQRKQSREPPAPED